MSLDEVIARDVEKVFLAGDGQGFDVEITITPQGGTARTARAIVTEGQNTLFYTNTVEHDFDVNEILVSAKDGDGEDYLPKVTGRDGQGDKINLPNSGEDWYVKDWIEDGSGNSGTGMHRLVIANTLGILVSESI